MRDAYQNGNEDCGNFRAEGYPTVTPFSEESAHKRLISLRVKKSEEEWRREIEKKGVSGNCF